jgi:cellulose synthase/poly-beta-1,6-N-acetylglucosamine synthase-like glycosyltransferase
MKLSVIMPVVNEADTIGPILERVLAVPLEKEIIVVDDGSSDGAWEVLLRHALPFEAPRTRLGLHLDCGERCASAHNAHTTSLCAFFAESILTRKHANR